MRAGQGECCKTWVPWIEARHTTSHALVWCMHDGPIPTQRPLLTSSPTSLDRMGTDDTRVGVRAGLSLLVRGAASLRRGVEDAAGALYPRHGCPEPWCRHVYQRLPASGTDDRVVCMCLPAQGSFSIPVYDIPSVSRSHGHIPSLEPLIRRRLAVAQRCPPPRRVLDPHRALPAPLTRSAVRGCLGFCPS